MSVKFGRNDSCPCGSGNKLKQCCDGKVPWEEIVRKGNVNPYAYQTTRGKNLSFLNIIGGALQLNSLNQPIDWVDIKRACTPNAIRQIHEALADIWPSEKDLNRIYESERGKGSGLYVGVYDTESILKGVTRHSIYSDRILLFDPFMDPRAARGEFNPAENPQKHVINTIQHLRMWYELQPWIEAGLVGFIKKPEDFNVSLGIEALRVENVKFANNPELSKLLDKAVLEGQDSRDFKELQEFRFLSKSDEEISGDYLSAHPTADYFETQSFLDEIHRQRDRHPYYIDLRSTTQPFSNQLISRSSGTAHYIAKMVAADTGSHIITDIAPRWKEIELDRDSGKAEVNPWTPFSKALQNSELKFLENISLKQALTLRQEERLEKMRSFLRKTWKAAHGDNDLSDQNAIALADELRDRVQEAEIEWERINSDLTNSILTETGSAAATVAGGFISTGAAILAGALALSKLGPVATAWRQRRSFPDRYPAAFFLGSK